MRVLLINQFFWPDLAATGVLLTDLCRHLRSKGHDVTVICGTAAYEVPEASTPPDVRIIRIPNLVFGRGKFMRLVSYASFYIGAALRAATIRKPDVVVSMTTPPLLSVIGHAVQKMTGARHFVWEMDLYPDVATDLKVLRPTSAISRLIGALADFTRRRADGVIALGECMERRLIARGIPAEKVHIAHNWADGDLIRPSRTHTESNKLTLIYAGHLGLAHDIETIATAMDRLDGRRAVRFLFVGGGPRSRELQRICSERGLSSVEFIDFCTRENLNQLFAQADVGLVTQKNDVNGSLVPSKVYTLLAAGLPLIYIGPESATPGVLVRSFDCGWHVECGDADRLVAVLNSLAADRAAVQRRGELARSVFARYFDRPVAVERVATILGLTNVASDRAAA